MFRLRQMEAYKGNQVIFFFTSLMASTSAPDDRSSLTTEVCPICEAIHKGVA